MVSLQYLIDHMCAKFTARTMMDLVREQIDQGTRTSDEITKAVIEQDRSLDFASARQLVEAAVQSLMDVGVVEMRDDRLYRT